MGAATGVLLKGTEFAGTSKLVCLTAATVAASDTITLTEAVHGIKAITAVVGINFLAPVVTGSGGQAIGASADGLVLTVTTLESDGTANAVFGQQYSVTVLGTV